MSGGAHPSFSGTQTKEGHVKELFKPSTEIGNDVRLRRVLCMKRDVVYEA
jgi:hypothetical protein